MMAIADVVTVGYGTFSSVNKVPTRGFGSTFQLPGIEYRWSDLRLHYTMDDQRLHYENSDHRLHYTAPER